MQISLQGGDPFGTMLNVSEPTDCRWPPNPVARLQMRTANESLVMHVDKTQCRMLAAILTALAETA